MTLQALREKIGDPAFFQLMRSWAQQNRFGNVATSGFVAAAERISGMELDPFLQTWLYEEGKPTSW